MIQSITITFILYISGYDIRIAKIMNDEWQNTQFDFFVKVLVIFYYHADMVIIYSLLLTQYFAVCLHYRVRSLCGLGQLLVSRRHEIKFTLWITWNSRII